MMNGMIVYRKKIIKKLIDFKVIGYENYFSFNLNEILIFKCFRIERLII